MMIACPKVKRSTQKVCGRKIIVGFVGPVGLENVGISYICKIHGRVYLKEMPTDGEELRVFLQKIIDGKEINNVIL